MSLLRDEEEFEDTVLVYEIIHGHIFSMRQRRVCTRLDDAYPPVANLWLNKALLKDFRDVLE
jgi:hypothetical protein